MIKKFFLAVLLSITAIGAVSIMHSQPTYANDCNDFLGLKPWHCNVPENDQISSQEDLQSTVWIIAANVLADITVVAAYLIVGFVIYGGYQYLMSNGDPGKVANGKKTLFNAFIGLAIVMLANIILNSISAALGGVNFSDDCVSSECGVSPGEMVTNAIQWVIGVAGIVSAIFVVYGGISYITSTGDPGKTKKARDTILYALIGLIIVALSEIIVSFVSGIILDAAIIPDFIKLTTTKGIS